LSSSGLIVRPQTAEVFAPLWERQARYKGAYGGRGSGKSNDRAQAVIIGMLTRPGFRVVCVREVQNSIKDSVKQLLEDWIQRLGVSPLFDCMRDEIRGPGGSLCLFRGMNDQNADTIKSLEGVDVAWWEEAQTASERSLQLLRPTIRKPGSELWFTWNPRYRTDPIDVFLRQNPPEGAVVVEANWSDNPWFPSSLDEERREYLRGDEDVYRHVWLGDYEKAGDRLLIASGLVHDARKAVVEPQPQDALILGVDVARYGEDESVIAIRRGRTATEEAWRVFKRLDTMEVAARVAGEIERLRPDAVFIDDSGVGGGVVDRLQQLGHDVFPVNFGGRPDGLTKIKTANKRAEMWVRMREWLAQGQVSIPDDRALEVQLTSVEYKHDANNAILLEKKEDMRRRGLPSPDRADALALTFAYPVQRADAGFWDDYGARGRSEATGY
jgi:hypothetical protein